MKKLFSLVFFCTILSVVSNAQTQDKKWNFGLHAGISQYNGDLGSEFYKADYALSDLNAIGGFSISRYLTSHFDVSFMATKGKVGYNRPDGYFSSGITSALINFRFNIVGPTSVVRPYLFLGGGAMLFDKNLTISNKQMDYTAPSFGAGINFKLSPVVMFKIQETFLYSNEDIRDGKVAGQNDMYLFHTIGFSFNFGNKKDEDKDGVADRSDKCLGTPANIAVDKTGCPVDKDKDGIADYLDGCPDVAGTLALNGCPDRDNDGIADKDDHCPDIAGKASLQGCPDKDGDGIADADDHCPDVAGLLKMQGCPDTDGDGVADNDDRCANTPRGYKVDASGCGLDDDKDGVVNEEDRCPKQSGVASLKGCPDTDGDGVADLDDRCPLVAGLIANKGCPNISREDVQRISLIGNKLFFENNSDKLKVASLVQLDILATILTRYESANLEIQGHTDNVGDDAKNMTLSQNRTESVKAYLVKKGISETRITATGFGETKPIADNRTPLGKAKNRRVELKASY